MSGRHYYSSAYPLSIMSGLYHSSIDFRVASRVAKFGVLNGVVTAWLSFQVGVDLIITGSVSAESNVARFLK